MNIKRLKNIIKKNSTLSKWLRYIRFLCLYKKYSSKYDIITIYDYVNQSNIDIHKIRSPRITKVTTLKFHPCYAQTTYEIKLPQVWMMSLTEGQVIGNSNIILDNNGLAIYNGNVGDNLNNYDSALQTGLTPYPTIGKSKYIIIRKRGASIDSGISLILDNPKNYYHFTHDLLAKFWVLSQISIPYHIPLIINTECLSIPQFAQLISLFNVDNRPIIKINHLESISVAKLYIISPIKITNGIPRQWNQVSDKYPAFNFDALNFLRNKIFSTFKAKKQDFPERIFISRKNCSLRNYNEAELEVILNKRGFVSICPEELSIIDQIQIFNNSKYIVAASGAALTNLLYCRKGSVAIVFINKNLNMPFYSSISSFVGCNLIYIAADNINDEMDYHSSIHINPQDLKDVLNKHGI